MEWFIYINAGVGMLALAAFGLAQLIDALSLRRSRKDEAAQEERREQDRTQLMSDSWWFSEDEPTMVAIQQLAEGHDVSTVRERWRKARKPEEARP